MIVFEEEMWLENKSAMIMTGDPLNIWWNLDKTTVEEAMQVWAKHSIVWI